MSEINKKTSELQKSFKIKVPYLTIKENMEIEYENLSKTCSVLSLNMEDIIARSQSQEIDELYNNQTSDAAYKGIFGSPSFIVGSEVFWGDDRLEDAIEWLRNPSKVGL